MLDPRDPLLQSESTQGFAADPDYGRAKCLHMLGEIKTLRTKKMTGIRFLPLLGKG